MGHKAAMPQNCEKIITEAAKKRISLTEEDFDEPA